MKLSITNYKTEDRPAIERNLDAFAKEFSGGVEKKIGGNLFLRAFSKFAPINATQMSRGAYATWMHEPELNRYVLICVFPAEEWVGHAIARQIRKGFHKAIGEHIETSILETKDD